MSDLPDGGITVLRHAAKTEKDNGCVMLLLRAFDNMRTPVSAKVGKRPAQLKKVRSKGRCDIKYEEVALLREFADKFSEIAILCEANGTGGSKQNSIRVKTPVSNSRSPRLSIKPTPIVRGSPTTRIKSPISTTSLSSQQQQLQRQLQKEMFERKQQQEIKEETSKDKDKRLKLDKETDGDQRNITLRQQLMITRSSITTEGKLTKDKTQIIHRQRRDYLKRTQQASQVVEFTDCISNGKVILRRGSLFNIEVEFQNTISSIPSISITDDCLILPNGTKLEITEDQRSSIKSKMYRLITSSGATETTPIVSQQSNGNIGCQKEYIREHAIHTILGTAMDACLREVPKDPYSFIAYHLLSRRTDHSQSFEMVPTSGVSCTQSLEMQVRQLRQLLLQSRAEQELEREIHFLREKVWAVCKLILFLLLSRHKPVANCCRRCVMKRNNKINKFTHSKHRHQRWFLFHHQNQKYRVGLVTRCDLMWFVYLLIILFFYLENFAIRESANFPFSLFKVFNYLVITSNYELLKPLLVY